MEVEDSVWGFVGGAEPEGCCLGSQCLQVDQASTGTGFKEKKIAKKKKDFPVYSAKAGQETVKRYSECV